MSGEGCSADEQAAAGGIVTSGDGVGGKPGVAAPMKF